MNIDLQQSDEVAVPLAPLLDCIFLLLIFFLVATTLRTVEAELELDLPVAAAAVGTTLATEAIVIVIDSEGTLHVEDAPVGATDLIHVLRGVAAQHPGQRIRIDTDRNAPAQAIVQVLDMCHFEGLSNIGIRTQRVPFGREDFRYHR